MASQSDVNVGQNAKRRNRGSEHRPDSVRHVHKHPREPVSSKHNADATSSPEGSSWVDEATESATSAGPHGRTAWALRGSAARPECVAQPEAWKVSPRRPGYQASRGGGYQAVALPSRRFQQACSALSIRPRKNWFMASAKTPMVKQQMPSARKSAHRASAQPLP
eukprot:scaffold37605_cov62-Phaeocystis_antarctica.AAC.11